MDEESAWIDEMVASTDIEQLRGEYAFLRSRWINYVNELRSLLLQLVALASQAESAVYVEKVAEYRRFKAALLRVKRLIEEANQKLAPLPSDGQSIKEPNVIALN